MKFAASNASLQAPGLMSVFTLPGPCAMIIWIESCLAMPCAHVSGVGTSATAVVLQQIFRAVSDPDYI